MMANGQSDKCCLCQSPIDDTSSQHKRKKLYGAGGSEARRVLERISLEYTERPLSSYCECNSNAYLCNCCNNLAKSVERIEKDLKKKIDGITRKLTRLSVNTQSPSATAHVGQKRPSLNSQLQAPNKVVCQNTSISQPSSTSKDVKVVIGPRTYNIDDQLRKTCVRKLVYRSYKSLASSLVNAEETSAFSCNAFGRKICNELTDICSTRIPSMMRDSNEAVKQFSWETIFLEFKAKLPTLVALVKFILPHVSKTLLCFVIGVIIKSRSPHMALVQRAVSVMLYANGANKQVYKCLQPLMVCLSHKRTIALVNRLSEDHDVEVLFWADELKKYIEERSFNYETIGNIDIGQCEDSAAEFSPSRSSVLSRQVSVNSSVVDHSFTDGSVADGSGESQESESFWPASDTSHIEMDTSLTFNEYSYIQPDTSISELDMSYIAPAYSPVRSPNDEHSLPGQPVTIDHVARANEDTVGQQTPVNTNEGATLGDVVTVQSNAWSGFKITIDNVDKNFRPSFQRIYHQTKSLHCVHMYAAKDWIDLSLYSNAPPQNVAITPEDILPSLNDLCSIKEHFKVLVSRILVQQMEKFSTQKKDVLWHIPFLYSEEMSMKSTVVPLGVINLNENKIDEMARIMDQIHRYVPTQTNNVTITFADAGDTLTYTEYNFHPICCSGDQLTAARERTAQSVRHHSENELDRLEGLVPVVDDWHTNMTLVKVIWKWLYSKQSATQKGTLFQLKNEINRTNIPTDPKDNLRACEDFLGVVLDAHVVAAAKTILTSNDYEMVYDMAAALVEQYVKIELPKPKPPQPRQRQPRQRQPRQTRRPGQPCQSVDSVHVYATEVLTLGLLWSGFNDAIREGDGDKVIMYWRFLLFVFKSGGCKNYSGEAVNLLSQLHILSPRLVAQLKWGRFVNTKGRAGCNIPSDLHMEHLNNRLKGILRNLGPNNSFGTIQRAANTIGVVSDVCRQFARELGVERESDHHKKKSNEKDFNIVLRTLEEKEVFVKKDQRTHSSFKLPKGHLEQINKEKLDKWLKEKIDSIICKHS